MQSPTSPSARRVPEVVYSKNVYIMNRDEPGMSVARPKVSFKDQETPRPPTSFKPVIVDPPKERNPAIAPFGSSKRPTIQIDQEKAEEFFNKFLLSIPESWCRKQTLDHAAFGEYQNRTLQDLMENPDVTMKFCRCLETYKLLSNLTFKFKTEMDAMDAPSNYDEMLDIEAKYLKNKKIRVERLVSYLSRRSETVLRTEIGGRTVEDWLNDRPTFVNCLMLSDKLYTVFNQLNYVDHHRQSKK